MGGAGLVDGGLGSIPTETIPPRLRALGSRFTVVLPLIAPEAGDAIDELATATRANPVRVEEPDGAR